MTEPVTVAPVPVAPVTVELAAGPQAGHRRPLPGPLSAGALVVIDVQRSFADPAHYHPSSPAVADAVATSIARIQDLLDVARRTDLQVCWVRLEQTDDAPWSASNWLRGDGDGDGDDSATEGQPCRVGTPGVEWFGVAPAPGELVVPKRCYSGFLGTDLIDRLRSAGVTWLIVAGLTTECCVTATAQDAIQYGLRVMISADATAAYDLDWHRYALEVLATNVGLVATTADLVEALDAAGDPL